MDAIVQECKVANILHPQTISAATTGDYVSMKNYQHCTFIIGVGSCGHAATIRVREAKNVSGSSAATLSPGHFWVTGTTPSDTWTKTSVTSSAIPLTGSSDNTEYVIEVDGEQLSASFDCLTLDTTSASASMAFHAVAILSKPRFAAASPPTALTD